MNYEYFMKKALNLAEKALSKGEFPVGCVMVYENKVLVSGSRIHSKGTIIDETEHAEIIALRKLTHKKDIEKSKVSVFCNLEPCLMCYGALIISGIGEIVYAYEDVMGGGTSCDLSMLTPLYKNTRVSVVPNILRGESLKLFKAYFLNPETNYLQGSLLETFTLSQ
ncbi:MAG: nucleoside deaminase [Deltaproteobacteria bacterium]|nr:nucleoside deaminase [Deltaproteobacteria bacterium]MBW2562624.1 nucleoside deaminase [Deltaproteobacteria bacterium]